MIAQLSTISAEAEPTPFHRVLKSLDDSGKLLRVYTQNIDSIEHKSGLTFGVPSLNDRKPKSKSFKSSPEVPYPTASSSRQPSPTPDTPRCIPLHGTVQRIHCPVCTTSFPLDNHLDLMSSGVAPDCPECTSMEQTRQLVGKRPRGVYFFLIFLHL